MYSGSQDNDDEGSDGTYGNDQQPVNNRNNSENSNDMRQSLCLSDASLQNYDPMEVVATTSQSDMAESPSYDPSEWLEDAMENLAQNKEQHDNTNDEDDDDNADEEEEAFPYPSNLLLPPISPLSTPSKLDTLPNDSARMQFIKKHISKLNLMFRRKFSADNGKFGNKVASSDKPFDFQTLKEVLRAPTGYPCIPSHWTSYDVSEYMKDYERIIEEGNRKIRSGELPNYLLQNNQPEQDESANSQETRFNQQNAENRRPIVPNSLSGQPLHGLQKHMRMRREPLQMPNNSKASWLRNVANKPSNFMNESDLPWANIYYNEYQARVGDIYKPKVKEITIDGLCVVGCENRFSIGSILNGNRRSGVANIRSQIGKGIRLVYDGTNCMCYSLGKGPVFIQSTPSGHPNTLNVYRLGGVPDSGSTGAQSTDNRPEDNILVGMAIFDARCFYTAFNRAIESGNMREIVALRNACTVRISFIKGFGPNYSRPEITDTPVWIEISFLKFLSLIDQAIVSANETDSVGSRSP